jgi:hypothetical protein
MFDLISLTIGVIIIFAAVLSYNRTRDALAPTLIFAPFLLYTYCYRPLILNHSGALLESRLDPESLLQVQVINVVTILGFLTGLGWLNWPSGQEINHFRVLRSLKSTNIRRSAFQLSIFFGVISFSVFWFTVFYSGGPIHVFSSRKPFLISPIASGYFNELTLLSYPALFMLGVSWQGFRLTLGRIMLALLIASPHITMGTIGGRRGPAFLITVTLAMTWLIVRQRRLNYRWIAVGLLMLGLFLIALNEFRGDLFRLDREASVYLTVSEALMAKYESTIGDEFIAGSAVILTAKHHEQFYWGKRYFTWFVIRPIPTFLWPQKYEFFGMEGMKNRPGRAGFTSNQGFKAVGFEVAGGSAGGFVSDLFLEFAWMGIPIAFLIGRFYSWVWNRSIMRGGLWTLIYMQMLMVSIYLPTQNVEAWLYRVILLGCLTWGFWKVAVIPHLQKQQRAAKRMEWESRRINYGARERITSDV